MYNRIGCTDTQNIKYWVKIYFTSILFYFIGAKFIFLAESSSPSDIVLIVVESDATPSSSSSVCVGKNLVTTSQSPPPPTPHSLH